MAELRVTSTGTIKLFESDDTSSVTIASPASLGGDRTITLPDANVDLTEVNTMPIANLDIDGGTDIGANIADSDLLIIDDGAGGTNRKTAASRLKTYVGAGAGAFDIANLDIDGGTDIGAAITDSDLFIIDDGAGGTNRKTAASRLKTYIGGAGLVFIQSQAVSSNTSQVNFDGVFTTTYNNYLLVFDITPNTGGADVHFNFRTTAPANHGSAYYSGIDAVDHLGNNDKYVQNDDSKLVIAQGPYDQDDKDLPTVSGHCIINGPFRSSFRTSLQMQNCYNTTNGDYRFGSGGCFVNSTAQFAGFSFSTSSGDINNMTGKVYGIVDS